MDNFAYYLSIGMTSFEYWDKDPTLVKYYREAEEMRMEKHNHELWLQGMYIYEAVGNLSPILRAFGGKNAKALPYPEEPYAITNKAQRIKEENKQKNIMEKGLRMFATLMKK